MMGDSSLLQRGLLAVTRVQAVWRGRLARRSVAQLRRSSEARRLMELMGVPPPAPVQVAEQAGTSPTPGRSEQASTTAELRPAQPNVFVMPPLPPGPPPHQQQVAQVQPTQAPPPPPPPPMVQPPLPMGAPPIYAMPAVPQPPPPPPAPQQLPTQVLPAASQAMAAFSTAAMLSAVPQASTMPMTPGRLDLGQVGLGQPSSGVDLNSPNMGDDIDYRRQQQGFELQSPQTGQWQSRVQSRVQHADGLSPMSPLHRMGAAAMHAAELSPQERLLTAVVMQRFCRWGEHRTVADWPAELRAYGPLPAIHEALKASRTRSLTLPQLVTAIKERTGGCAGRTRRTS